VQLEEVETMKRSVFPFLIVLVVCSPVLGEHVTVSFTGEVDLIYNPHGVDLPGGFVVGAAVTGTYSYDTTCSVSLAGTNFVDYTCDSPPALISMEIAGHSSSTSPGGTEKLQVSMPLDQTHVVTTQSVAPILSTIPGVALKMIWVRLTDDTGTVLANLDLPDGGHVLFPWTRREGGLEICPASDPLCFVPAVVRSEVTSLTLEPPGGSCSPDKDGDGIQESVDPNDNSSSIAFTDTSTRRAGIPRREGRVVRWRPHTGDSGAALLRQPIRHRDPGPHKW
jgi:hypothetical protein